MSSFIICNDWKPIYFTVYIDLLMINLYICYLIKFQQVKGITSCFYKFNSHVKHDKDRNFIFHLTLECMLQMLLQFFYIYYPPVLKFMISIIDINQYDQNFVIHIYCYDSKIIGWVILKLFSPHFKVKNRSRNQSESL